MSEPEMSGLGHKTKKFGLGLQNHGFGFGLEGFGLTLALRLWPWRGLPL